MHGVFVVTSDVWSRKATAHHSFTVDYKREKKENAARRADDARRGIALPMQSVGGRETR